MGKMFILENRKSRLNYYLYSQNVNNISKILRDYCVLENYFVVGILGLELMVEKFYTIYNNIVVQKLII